MRRGARTVTRWFVVLAGILSVSGGCATHRTCTCPHAAAGTDRDDAIIAQELASIRRTVIDLDDFEEELATLRRYAIEDFLDAARKNPERASQIPRLTRFLNEYIHVLRDKEYFLFANGGWVWLGEYRIQPRVVDVSPPYNLPIERNADAKGRN